MFQGSVMSWQAGASVVKMKRMHLFSYIFLSAYSFVVIAFACTAQIAAASILLLCVCISTEYQSGINLFYIDTCLAVSYMA